MFSSRRTCLDDKVLALIVMIVVIVVIVMIVIVMLVMMAVMDGGTNPPLLDRSSRMLTQLCWSSCCSASTQDLANPDVAVAFLKLLSEIVAENGVEVGFMCQVSMVLLQCLAWFGLCSFFVLVSIRLCRMACPR